MTNDLTDALYRLRKAAMIKSIGRLIGQYEQGDQIYDFSEIGEGIEVILCGCAKTIERVVNIIDKFEAKTNRLHSEESDR